MIIRYCRTLAEDCSQLYLLDCAVAWSLLVQGVKQYESCVVIFIKTFYSVELSRGDDYCSKDSEHTMCLYQVTYAKF